MGATYTNILVKGASQVDMADFVKNLGLSSYVSPLVEECVVIWPDERRWSMDGRQLAYLISKELKCAAWSVMVYDDDDFLYEIFRDGVFFGDYQSGKSSGTAHKLCQAFDRPQAQARVIEILFESEYVFEMDRHSDLLEALGLPSLTVGTDYRFLKRGDHVSGLDRHLLVLIEDDRPVQTRHSILFMQVPDGVSFAEDIFEALANGEDIPWSLGHQMHVRAKLAEVLPSIDYYDPAHGYGTVDGIPVNVSLEGNSIVSMVTVEFRKDDSVLPIVRRICKHTGWRAGDMQAGDFYDFDNA